MNKFIWFTIVSIFSIVFVIPALALIPLKIIPINDQPGFNGGITKVIYGDIKSSQFFHSNISNFAAIGTSIKNPSLANKKEIIMDLYDSGGNIIRTVKLNGYNIGDGQYVKFVFEPISDSLNKDYQFTISSPQAADHEAIGVFWDELYGIPTVYYKKPDNRLAIAREVYANLFSRLLLRHFQKF